MEDQENQEDLDEQCHGPEGDKYWLDQDWRGDQKHRSLQEPCKRLVVSKLMEERKEEEENQANIYLC